MINRIYDDLDRYLESNKVVVIFGPRRVGKTTLLRNFLDKTKLKYKLDSGENIKTQAVLSSQDFSKIFDYVGSYQLVAFDEAQYIPNIGLGLKIIVDQIKNIKVIATGSSSFDLSGQIGEPLVGRKRTLLLYPVSQKELKDVYTPFEFRENLENFLIFGSYPEVLTAKTKPQKIQILEDIANSYILKDILALEKIKGSKIILNLLKLLAFQVGNLVSLNELAITLGINVRTVNRYLDLLEKTFIIQSLSGYSRTLRNEISSKYKYYFVDNGIRNAVISQYNLLEDRNDVGALWENFIFMERFKKRAYEPISANSYYWRTYEGKEIDLVEEHEGKLFGYEIKWGKETKSKAQKEWLSTYKEAEFEVINQENYLKFIL